MKSNAVVEKKSTEPTKSFLDLTPPHWASRALSYVIISTVVVAGIASIVIKLPETVTASFVLAPTRGSDPIRTPRQGVADRVFVSEGQSVNQGDLILTLRSEMAGDRTADLMTLQTQMAGAGESFVNAKQKFSSQTLADESESRKLASRVEHLAELIAFKRQQVNLLKQLVDSDETLYREGIVSRVQLADRQLEHTKLAAELETLVAEQNETKLAIEKLRIESGVREAEFKEVQRTYKESAATGEIRIAALRSGLPATNGNEVRLTAPCAGTILRMNIKNGGAVLHEGEVVAELVCTGETLQAELKIPESGLGKLSVGQGVKLKYDAFPYQRYGVRYGRVSWLSPARSETNDGSTFRAQVELSERELTAQGQSHQFIAGMSGTAEIVVGNRSLIEYVFEPLRKLRENYSDVPERLTRR